MKICVFVTKIYKSIKKGNFKTSPVLKRKKGDKMQVSKINVNMPNFITYNKAEDKTNQNSFAYAAAPSMPDVSEIAGRSMVNFRAKGFVLNKLDNGFIENLQRVFNLSNEAVQDVRKIVADFIKENKLKSLSDIGGDDFCNEQGDLVTKITEKLGLDEAQNNRLINEVGFRCDSKDKYKPENAEAYHNELTSFEDEVENLYESYTDKRFTDVIAKLFKLSDEENTKMLTIISDTLKSRKRYFLKDLKYTYTCEMELSEIVDKVSKELNFSDYDEILFTREAINWIDSGKSYQPVIKDIDLDFNDFNAICEKHKIDYNTRAQLFEMLKASALKKNASSIFDVFDASGNDFKKAQNKVMQMTDNDNFLIDLALYKKNPEKVNVKIQKHKVRDDFYKRISSAYAAEEIEKEFGVAVTKEFLLKLGERFPLGVENGMNKDLKQLAYEIADKYQLPGGAEQKIVEIINKADNLETSKLDVFLVEKLEQM